MTLSTAQRMRATRIAQAFSDLAIAARSNDSGETANEMLTAFETFVALVRGEIARQTKLEERE
jgi:hypothetical protein